MGSRLVLLPLLGLLALGYAAKCPKQRTSPGREILCYTTTTDVKLLEDSICRCTTLVHQGHDLKDLSTSDIEEFQKSLKEMNPVLQIVLSVSDEEGTLKTSARIRQEAAARIVRVLNEVDGIELNVTAGTKERLVHFVQGLKTEMVRKSKDKRILLVLPTKPDDLAKQFDLKALSKYVDLFTLPTHYLVDDEEAFRTFHPSRLMGLFDMLNTDSLVDLVSGLGAGKRKILVSLPASVYKFALEKNDENAPRAVAKGKLPVQISRSKMCEAMDEGEWIVERDEDLTAPYAFKDDTWIAFEDKISAGIKGKYVLLRDLAGLGIHNVEKDSKSKCGNSLTEDVYHSFTDNKRKTREAVLTSLQEDIQQTQSPSSGHVKSSGFRIVRVVDTDGHIHAMRENTQTEFSCPRQGYFVHPKSCNRFYRCVKFNQGVEDYSVFEFDCPAGLAFDESTEVCVWPGSISACSGSSEIAPSKGAKFTCPNQPGYYADPQNCRFFYACFDLGEPELTAYEFRCPYGLVFDEQKLICEWPYLVPSCGGGTYERHDYGGSGLGGSNQGEHGGSNQGGYGGSNQGGHGGSNQGGYGGSNQGGHGGSNQGGYGGSNQGGHGGSNQGGYGGANQGGHGGSNQGGYGGFNQGGHGGSNQGRYGGSNQGGYGGSNQGGHGGSNQGGYGGSNQGEHGGADQDGDGGYGGADQDGHGGVDQGGHGGYGGSNQGGYGGLNQGGHGGSNQGGYGGSNQGGHGGSDQGGHGVSNQGGYGGSNQGGLGGSDQGGHGVSNQGGHGGVDQGGHGGYGGFNQGGYGGSNQGGYGGSNQGGLGGSDQGGHGVSNQGGYGGSNQGGYGESNQGGYGGSDQGGHGGSNQGGHGGPDQDGHGGYGGADQDGDGGADQGGYGGLNQGGYGGSNQDGYGGSDQGGHGVSNQGGYGGSNQGGYGGSNQGGYGGSDQGGHGGSDQGGHGGLDQGGHGGSDQGGDGEADQGGHGGYGGADQGGHGGTDQGGHGGYGGADQGGHGGTDQGGYGGSNQGGYDETNQGGHRGSSQGGYDGSGQSTIHSGAGEGSAHGSSEGGYGGSSQGGYGDSSQGGYGGTTQGGYGGSTQGGYGDSDQSGHGGSTQGDYGGTSQGGYGGSTHSQHGGSSENGHTGPYTTQDGYTSSSQGSYGAGGTKSLYTTPTPGSYTKNEPKYPATSNIGYSPAPGVGIFTNPGGYSGQSSTIAGSSGHQTSVVNAGVTATDTGVHTGVSSGGYDGHTATIQYGGQTRPAVIYEVEETTSHGGSPASGNTGTMTYHGNFGSTGSQGGYGSSGHTDGDSGISAGITTGSYAGSQGPTSAGSTTYHGNFGSSGYGAGGSPGSISSGAATQGVIATGDSTSGTVYTHGDVAGTVHSGNSEQGGIVTGITQPGYVHTQSGTPGYVITNGVKTIYDGSVSKSTFAHGIPGDGAIITGAPAPGVVLTGNSSPGTYLAGQTSPGVIIGGAVTPGVSIGDSTDGKYYTGGSRPSIYNGAPGSRGQTTFTSASKTPNYPNNPFLGQTWPVVVVGNGGTSDASYGSTGGTYYPGGSETSVYNRAPGSRGQTTFTSASNIPNIPKNPFTSVTGDAGYKTNEYHDNGGRGTIRYNNGEVTHKFTEDDVRDHRTQFGTYPSFDVGAYEASTASQGTFTKTGPTKTGIVTAEVGGSGTYVAGSRRPRPFSSTQNIGANAFGSTSSTTSNSLSYGTSTGAPNLSYTTQQPDYDSGSIDVSKINLGFTNRESSSGYSYTKPAVQLNTFGVSDSTKAPILPGQETPGFSTSPAPFLDVHVYNSPSVVTSAPITASPAVVNTYTYNKPSGVQYEHTGYQSPNVPFSSGAASTGTYSRPIATEQRKFPSVSSTVAPIAFTTGPLENFKTTVFEAARIPASISTVQPVIDTGYKTVVSPTPFSVGVNTDGFGYSQSTGYRGDSLSTKDNSALGVNVAFQQPDFSTQGQYDNGDIGAPAVIGSSGYSTSKSRRPSVTQSVTYKRPTVQQVTYESTGSSDYSESNDYNEYSHTQTGGTFGQRVSQGVSVTPTVNYATPTVVIPPQIYNIPSSTIAPAIGVTYREPFQIEQSTPRPISQSRVPPSGYTYSKPSVNFVSSTTPSISYKQEDSYESKTTKSGGSPTNLDISRTEVEKLITNYDRGSAKYTPSGYETYSDNTGNRYDETSLNTNRYSGQQSYASTKTSFADKSQSGGYNKIYSTTPSYELNPETLNFGGRVEGSSSYGVSNSNLDITINSGAVPSTTYLPISSSPSPGRKVTSSSRRPPFYSITTPAVTTYSGNYNRGPSTPSYEAPGTGVGRPKGKGKVIVKFSDLHPLLLGKLGAECTCKADPFASFRGSKPLPINSSKGRVDLRNYDESDVYVDLEESKENGDYDSGEYTSYLEGSTPANYDDGKYETPVVAVFDGVTPATKGTLKSRRPSSNYLPGSSSSTYLPPVSSSGRPTSPTYLPAASSTKRPSSSTYLPPSSTYLPSAASSNRGGAKASFSNDGGFISTSLTSARGGGFRVGKKLGDSSSTTGNALTGQGAAFDRYGPGGLRGIDETLQGTGDCARSGLFRHPNFCNKFYACHWDEWKKKFTLHVFNCPVHLTFDNGAGACNWPSKGPACQDDNLLV